MRIFGRRDDATPSGRAGSTAGPPPGPADGPTCAPGRTPRPGSRSTHPTATYAAVLDGVHLWWHVPGHTRLTLREAGGTAQVDAAGDPVSLDVLADLPGEVFDVLVDGVRVQVGELPRRAPARTPVCPTGDTQYDVALDDGHLQVLRHPVPPIARLLAVDLRRDRLRMHVAAPPGGPADRLLLLDEAGAVAASVPTTPAGETSVDHATAGPAGERAPEQLVTVDLGVEELPSGRVGVLRVAVGTPDSWVRVRRGDTGLLDPNRAVLLPELVDPEHPDRVRARLRWSPDAMLALRLLDGTEPG